MLLSVDKWYAKPPWMSSERYCRWHLAVTGQKEAKLYLVNGLILTVLFFVVRVLCYGAGLWHLWTLR